MLRRLQKLWKAFGGLILLISLAIILLQTYNGNSSEQRRTGKSAETGGTRAEGWRNNVEKLEALLESSSPATRDSNKRPLKESDKSSDPPPGPEVTHIAQESEKEKVFMGQRKTFVKNVTTHGRKDSSSNIDNLPQCTIPFTPTHKRYEAVSKSEQSTVYSNLEKCLSAANLTQYFKDTDWYSKAMDNALKFISTLREIIPAQFSRSFQTPCWETSFNLRYCRAATSPHSTEYRLALEGEVGSMSFKSFAYTLRTPLMSALLRKYPEDISSSLVCLPKVFLAGFPKCGSSYVYCLLEKLAGIVDSSHHMHHLEKEPHFWVPSGPSTNHAFVHHPSDFAHYLMNFLPAVEAEIESGFSLPVDGSPNLMFQWPRYVMDEGIVNYCLVPAVLPQVLPDSRYIVVMRDPVDALYSAFWFSCSTLNIDLNREQQLQAPALFHERVVHKIDIFNGCLHQLPIDKCMEDIFVDLVGINKQCGRVRLELAFYHLYIRRWLAIVPREQFLFLTIEELKSQGGLGNVANRILRFLGFGVHVESEETLRNSTSSQEDSTFCNNVQTRYDYHHDPLLMMRDDTRKILRTLFEPYNKELAKLLRDDRYLWSA